VFLNIDLHLAFGVGDGQNVVFPEIVYTGEAVRVVTGFVGTFVF
jgi:hypothetical protein